MLKCFSSFLSKFRFFLWTKPAGGPDRAAPTQPLVVRKILTICCCLLIFLIGILVKQSATLWSRSWVSLICDVMEHETQRPRIERGMQDQFGTPNDDRSFPGSENIHSWAKFFGKTEISSQNRFWNYPGTCVYIYDTYIIYWFILRIYLLFPCNCEASKNGASCELHRLQVSVSLDMFQVCPSPTRDERYPKTYYIHGRCWYERHIYSTHDYTSLIHVFLGYCVQYHEVIMCLGNMYIHIYIY